MRVTPKKVAEIREELSHWSRRNTVTKKLLQQLLGRLFWVSRCVKFSRPLIGRLLTQLKNMHHLPDNKKVKLSSSSKLDIKWWSRYMRKFNGVECMYPTDPLDGLSLDQMLDTSALVYCGDAQPLGGGGFFWFRILVKNIPSLATIGHNPNSLEGVLGLPGVC